VYSSAAWSVAAARERDVLEERRDGLRRGPEHLRQIAGARVLDPGGRIELGQRLSQVPGVDGRRISGEGHVGRGRREPSIDGERADAGDRHRGEVIEPEDRAVLAHPVDRGGVERRRLEEHR
jgi:hypothetical protein